MISKKLYIHNESGLHVRPAGYLVKAVSGLSCDIKIDFNGKQYNAKSVLGIMSACIKKGEEVTFICNGADEVKAMAAIEKAVADGLGE